MGNFKFTKLKWLIIPVVLVLGISTRLLSQITVTGTVTDQEGEALIGVNVLVQGTDQGTATDFEGRFELEEVQPDAILQFSYIGFQSIEVPVDANNNIIVEMISNSELLDEVIVVGYGTQMKSDLTGAVQRLDASQYENQSTTNLIEMLNGTVAGFNSNQGTSAAGGGSMEIRGQTSLKANNNPLIVLDGVIFNGNMNDINPSDIETIDILKDASSAAVFGARSASGVLIITTKRGKEGKPKINFSTKLGIVGTTNMMESYSPSEYLDARATVLRQIYPNRPDQYYTNPDELPSEISVEEWKNYDATPSNDPTGMWMNRLILSSTEQENYLSNNTTDWYDLVFRNGYRQNYDINLSGGSENVRYYWSGGYTQNEGNVAGDEFKTFRSRVNIDADISSFMKVGVNAQFKDEDNSSVPAGTGSGLYQQSPYGSPYNQDGTVKWAPNDDLIATSPLISYVHRDNFTKRQALFATIFAEVQLPFNFSYRISLLNRYAWVKDYLFDPVETRRGSDNGGFGIRNNSSINEWMVDNILRWHMVINDVHSINTTFLFNLEKYQSWSDNQQNFQLLPSPVLGYHALQTGGNPSLSSNDEYSTGNALMGRINYSLLDRYLFTATWRRDGYSAFGQSNPYANFPSLALGWRISNEGFYKGNVINDLKIRLSWGANGNRDIGRYAALARLGTTNYIYDNRPVSGVNSTTMENAALRWEKTEALNFGVDFGVYNSRISGSVEAYTMTTNDLLLDRSLPNIIGYSSVASNLGEVRNRGFEITLNSFNLDKPGNFNWNSSLVLSLNRNKILHLYGDKVDVTDENGNIIGQKEADDIDNQWFIGEALDRVWDYDIEGVWQLGDEDKASVFGKVPGDHKLQDVNDDGVLSPLDDKVFQGYKKPRYRLGFRNDFTIYKQFQLSFFVRADLGFQRNNPLYKNSHFLDRANYYSVPYWTENNRSNEWPRLDPSVSSPSYNVWKNSSFVRLQDLSFSYNVPKHILTRIKTSSFRVFLSLRNALTFTEWNYWDPETGGQPMPKYYTVGIDISL